VTEHCGVCGDAIPIRGAVHVTVNTKTDAGVVDYYVCRACYDDRVAALFRD